MINHYYQTTKRSVCKRVAIYATTWATFKSKLEKTKQNPLLKKYSCISGYGIFLIQKKFLKLSCPLPYTPSPTQKKKNKKKKQNVFIFTLEKTPLGEAGCLSNLYYLLAAQGSSFLIHQPFPNTVI